MRDRKRLEREKAYFWQMATFGGASGTLAFFLNPCRPPYARDFAKTHAVVTGIKVQGIMRGNDDVTSCISKIS
jgi:hypothetical protein